MYTYQEMKKNVNFVQGFHSSSKNKIHKHVPATKYNLSNFGDSANMVNALIFAFQMGIAQYNDEQ